jgi:hypothetical protein
MESICSLRGPIFTRSYALRTPHGRLRVEARLGVVVTLVGQHPCSTSRLVRSSHLRVDEVDLPLLDFGLGLAFPPARTGHQLPSRVQRRRLAPAAWLRAFRVLQPDDDLAFLNPVALVHSDPGDLPQDFGRHLNLVRGDDVAGRVQDHALSAASRADADRLHANHLNLRHLVDAAVRKRPGPAAPDEPANDPLRRSRKLRTLLFGRCKLLRSRAG